MSTPILARPSQLARHSAIATLPFLVVPFLVVLLIWAPEIAHVSAPQARITVPMVETARRSPGDEVLRELREFHLLPIEGRSSELEISIAERMLQGRLELPESPAGAIGLTFSADDFDRLPAGLQLSYAGFVVPDFLLAAYVGSGREEFFAAAHEFIGSWNLFEARTWLPKGLLWNDHAIAARVRVLAEYWRIYRSRPDYQPEVGQAVLEQAARYGYFLSSPEHFTFATNHGLMQNLGLLHLSLAFPSLPESSGYHEVALDRLGQQLTFLVDEAGVVRENSAGYQAFNLRLLAMAFRSMALLGDPVPDEWARRYTSGIQFLMNLRRPDGTLPATGDTDGASIKDLPRVTDFDANGMSSELREMDIRTPDRADTLEAATGYWIHWDGLDGWPAGPGLSQTVVTWTSPPAPGHKHADEMSVLLWSDGIAWLTSVGYWPYSEQGRSQAESWDGSNAPHLAEEGISSERTTTLLWRGWDVGAAAVDLERTGPGDYRARRQIVRVSPDVWLVLDLIEGADTTTSRTVWTISPDVELRPLNAPGSYDLLSRAGQASARIDYTGSPGTTFEAYRGSLAPFAGWHVVDGTPQPAPAIVVEQPGPSAWLAVAVSRTDASASGRVIGPPRVSELNSAVEWALQLPTVDGQLEIRRSGGAIVVTLGGQADHPQATLPLMPAQQIDGRGAVEAAFDAMAPQYPEYRSLSTRRTTVSLFIPLVTLGQEFFLLVVRRMRPRIYVPLRVVSLFCWVALAVWLNAVFLQSWVILTAT